MENQKTPFVVNLDPGSHYICRCGASKNPPFCDGSHKNTEFTPHMETILEAKTVAICACGKSDNIFCNGSHKNSDGQ